MEERDVLIYTDIDNYKFYLYDVPYICRYNNILFNIVKEKPTVKADMVILIEKDKVFRKDSLSPVINDFLIRRIRDNYHATQPNEWLNSLLFRYFYNGEYFLKIGGDPWMSGLRNRHTARWKNLDEYLTEENTYGN